MSSYKKIKSTIMVPEDTYKETRILAIRKGMDIGSLVDEALREKIVRDYQQMGLQPPFPQIQPQPQVQKLQQRESDIPATKTEPNRKILGNLMESQRKWEEELNELTKPPPRHHFQINLPGIEFPADKKEIIEYAKKANIEKMVSILKEIPDETYMNSSHVANSFVNIFKEKRGYLGQMYKEGIVCIINNKEIRQKEQHKQLLQEQEQLLTR